MNRELIKRLIQKDWYFSRKILAMYLVGGFAAIAFAFWGGEMGMIVGGIGLVATVMGVGIHLVFTTVVNERKEQTLPFIMSMPISIMDYTLAKIVANATAFLVPWLVLAATAIGVVYSWQEVPNGFIPVLSIMLVEMAVCNFIILAAAVITESEGWTIGVMAVCNTAFSVIFMMMKKLEGVGEFMAGSEVIWTPEAFAILGLEGLIIVLVLGVTFYFQGRKTSFI